ncbi:hypothetical protein VC892_17305 [Citrobacter portucalensis]|nr:hypothetical protein [Citrobacter portucalensis]MEB1081751.1 hypothetical protein [Citrobacter portucalensis]
MWGVFILSYLSAGINIPQIIDYSLSKLGEVSFSEYILHGVVLYSFKKEFGILNLIENQNTNAIMNFLIVFPIVILFSKICFELIEKPFLGFRKKYAK